MVCELTVPGDPQSKGRPRVYQGHGITPTRTRVLGMAQPVSEPAAI